jgi:hypothetical protein
MPGSEEPVSRRRKGLESRQVEVRVDQRNDNLHESAPQEDRSLSMKWARLEEALLSERVFEGYHSVENLVCSGRRASWRGRNRLSQS